MTDLDRALQRARNEMLAQRYGRVERHWERTDQAIHRADVDESRGHGQFRVTRSDQDQEADDWPLEGIS